MILKQIYSHRFENVAYLTMKRILDVVNIIVKMNLISGLNDSDTKAQLGARANKFFENIEERSGD